MKEIIQFKIERVGLEDKDILFRLLQYSLFEESINDGNEMNNDAVFEYKKFDRYFSDRDRNAFFIKRKEDNKLIGFVMIDTYMQKNADGHSIAEFMIIPKYRRNHIGKHVAVECFNMYKGNWEVSPSFGSEVAYKFWKKVIDEYTDGNYKFDDRLFMFSNK